MNNAILMGFRGTGKSSVAELVAMATNREAYHMDDVIVERAGRSIPELVEEKGWEAFRDIETAVAQEAAASSNLVIDTGGGVVLREENMTRLKASGTVFWLSAASDTIRSRIQDDTQRPSLTGMKSSTEEVDELLAERTPLYEQYADHVIHTDGRTLGEIASEIIDIVCGA